MRAFGTPVRVRLHASLDAKNRVLRRADLMTIDDFAPSLDYSQIPSERPRHFERSREISPTRALQRPGRDIALARNRRKGHVRSRELSFNGGGVMIEISRLRSK